VKINSPYSPAKEIQEGDLAILSSRENKGFCIQVEEITPAGDIKVRFLDSQLPGFFVQANFLIPSGKPASTLLKHIESRGVEFNKALEEERKFPDFEEKKTRSAKPAAKKPLTEVQKNYLGELIKARLKELAKKGD